MNAIKLFEERDVKRYFGKSLGVRLDGVSGT
jgi:hypothetical protein